MIKDIRQWMLEGHINNKHRLRCTQPYLRNRDNINPVIVAYNGNHYESLIPIESSDCIRSIELVDRYRKGTYNLGQSDMPKLTSTRQVAKTPNATKHQNLMAKAMEKGKSIQKMGVTA